MARRKEKDKKTFAVLVHIEDAREIRKLESRLWRYGEILTNVYVREEDEWGRMYVKSAVYVLRVPQSKLSHVKHSLTKLGQQNGFTVLF